MKTILIIGAAFVGVGIILYMRAKKNGAQLLPGDVTAARSAIPPNVDPAVNDVGAFNFRRLALASINPGSLTEYNQAGCQAGSTYLGAGSAGQKLCGPLAKAASGFTSAVVGGGYDTVKNLVTGHPIDAGKSLIETPVKAVKSLWPF
jgi:hypothetical protein